MVTENPPSAQRQQRCTPALRSLYVGPATAPEEQEAVELPSRPLEPCGQRDPLSAQRQQRCTPALHSREKEPLRRVRTRPKAMAATARGALSK